MLLRELPVKDKYGGLQGIAMDKIDIDILANDDGIDQLLNFLENLMMEPSYVNGLINLKVLNRKVHGMLNDT